MSSKNESEQFMQSMLEVLEARPCIIHCAICTKTIDDIRSTPCNHEFCPDCITDWLQRNKDNASCPICHQHLSPDSLKVETKDQYKKRQLKESLEKGAAELEEGVARALRLYGGPGGAFERRWQDEEEEEEEDDEY